MSKVMIDVCGSDGIVVVVMPCSWGTAVLQCSVVQAREVQSSAEQSMSAAAICNEKQCKVVN